MEPSAAREGHVILLNGGWWRRVIEMSERERVDEMRSQVGSVVEVNECVKGAIAMSS